MSKISSQSKLFVAFLSGALFVALLQVSPLKASTGEPTGSCVMLGHYSTWAWASTAGKEKEYNEMSVINFDTKKYAVIVNKSISMVSGEPEYREGAVERGDFTLVAGPMEGTYKMKFNQDNDYIILAPTNSGNTILVLDSVVGMTGVCQKT
jgi:hypothetical protein